MPGVRLILTGDDIGDLGLMPMQAGIPGVDIPVPRYPVLAQGEVRHVGDAVAFVVAETLEQAKDAAEAIDIEWEPRPHVIGAVGALERSAVQVWPDRPGNLAFEVALGNQAPTAKAMAGAPRTVSLTLVNQRLVTNYLDTRGVIAEYDAAANRLTLTLGSQGSHYLRDTLCEMLKLPPEKMRVVTPDVGGGFGTKLFVYREYALVALAARQLKKPVAWIADRSEHFLGDAQGRDNITTAELALDDKGHFLALRHRPDRRHGRVSVGLRAIHPVPWRRHVAGRLRYSASVTSGCAASIPTPSLSMLIAARAGPRPPT